MLPRVGADCPCEQGQTCWYVAPDTQDCRDNSPDGTYDHPFCGIQNAIWSDAVAENEIVLALPGTYAEGDIRFNTGGVGDPPHWVAKRIVLRSCEGPGRTIVAYNGEPCVPIFSFSREWDESTHGPETVLEGFTITGGEDAGVKCWLSSPTIRGNVITANTGTAGGGIHLYRSDAAVVDNIIEDNEATRKNSNPPMTTGGGIYIEDGSPLIWNNIIRGNRSTCAEGDCNPYYSGGGGIYIRAEEADPPHAPRIVWCEITCNEAWDRGGGIRIRGYAQPWISHCEIGLNKAIFGGGVFQGLAALVTENQGACLSTELVPVRVEDCLIYGNVADNNDDNNPAGRGGGVYFGDRSNPTMTNCTVVNNRAREYGGGVYGAFTCAYVYNSILWDNWVGTDNNKAHNEVRAAYHSDIGFWYTDIFPGDQGIIEVELYSQVALSAGVLRLDPQFRDAELCNYRVSSVSSPPSPVIDAGDNCLTSLDVLDVDEDTEPDECTPLDLAAHPRFLDDPTIQNTGVACPAQCPEVPETHIIDMGPYEYTAGGCPDATIVAAAPPDGTVDARQPHPVNDDSLAALQGIGRPSAPSEPIYITLSGQVTGADDVGCWALCETDDAGYGRNGILSVSAGQNPGEYVLLLRRPITAGAATTIEYVPDGSYVTYIAHPANVDEGPTASAADVTALVNCLNNPGTCTVYQADINHSGGQSVADLIMEINLLNGAGHFEPWFGTLLPDVGDCPIGVVCACSGPAFRGGEQGAQQDASAFGQALILYLTFVDFEDAAQAAAFPDIVEGFINLAHRVLSAEERGEVACALLDPRLAFVSEDVGFLISQIADALEQ
ncbi:MAG TPA: right-handed parallel beta-helix repeat-containing protein [Phycisphaerae bacterium]|nr:right-handed parallel beta-helix repeat-containing protein [Phycisphaerae bacterium]